VARVAGIPALSEPAYFDGMIDENAIRQRWEAVGSKLDERGRRLFAAGEVQSAGWGVNRTPLVGPRVAEFKV